LTSRPSSVAGLGDTSSIGVSVSDLIGIFKKGLKPLSERDQAEFYEHFYAVVPEVEQRNADFPEFLRLMRRILDINFADIKDLVN